MIWPTLYFPPINLLNFWHYNPYIIQDEIEKIAKEMAKYEYEREEDDS